MSFRLGPGADVDGGDASEDNRPVTKDVSLRAARQDEVDALGALKLRASLAYGDHVAELSALAEAGRLEPELVARTLVVDIGGVPVGFVSVVASDGADEIEELFVEPALWRSGYGRILLEEALRRSSDRGAATVRVVANRRARPFYERCGFAVVGELMTQFEPAPIMERRVG